VNRREVRPIVSHGLGLRQYPIGTRPAIPSIEGPGEHIMAIVALGWLSDITVDRWGEDWAQAGVIDLRFRSHLSAGLDLDLVAEHHDNDVELSVRDKQGASSVTGVASLGTADTPQPSLSEGSWEPMEPRPVPPSRERLDGFVLHPVEFDFVADRDLAFAAHLPSGSFWADRQWAHPAWLGLGAQAIVRHNIDFEDGGYWMYAGLQIQLHAPVFDGSHLEMRGRVSDLFDRTNHRFATCEVLAIVNDDVVASMHSTFVYGPAQTS
jgi:hypothetical protein